MHACHACRPCMPVMHTCHACMSCIHVARTTASLRSDNGLASLGQRTCSRARLANFPGCPVWALFWQFPVGEFARLPGWPCPVIAQLLAGSQTALRRHEDTSTVPNWDVGLRESMPRVPGTDIGYVGAHLVHLDAVNALDLRRPAHRAGCARHGAVAESVSCQLPQCSPRSCFAPLTLPAGWAVAG